MRGVFTDAASFLASEPAGGAVVVNVDFRGLTVSWDGRRLDGVVFLGCDFNTPHEVGEVVARGGLVFPDLPNLPYDPYRERLYTWQELATPVADGRSVDLAIYEHFEAAGRHQPSLVEALAQRLHDHATDSALRSATQGAKLVGIMGGHAALRTDDAYRDVVHVARDLTRRGYHVASGGGPGIMEAANLGAWLAPCPDAALDEALSVLAEAPSYQHASYDACARRVLSLYPDGAPSLAIPTWFYGHEPSNLFGTGIAKYFSNSIREDALLAICVHGIVFAPGSAGTTQEIFQDAAQNHYGTFGHISPMVFLGTERYAKRTRLYETLHELADGRPYQRMMALTDDPAAAAQWIADHPPEPA